MRAVVASRSGPPEVLRIEEVPKPAPKADEILVRVHAATVTRGDVALRKMPRWLLLPVGLLFGFKAQKIPGVEFAGTVEAAGESVAAFGPGDAVFGTTTGLARGANADYVCVPENSRHGVVASKPTGVPFEDAACLPVGGMTALWLLQKASVKAGDEVLVYGASGSVGTYAVQLARHFGAHVTGVCSGANAALVQSLGAAATMDHTKDDFSAGGRVYDVVFDAVGKVSRSRAKKALKPGGRHVGVRSLTRENTDNLLLLGRLCGAGDVRAVIDRSYALDDVVAAHRYVEAGHKRGNVVLVLDGTAPDHP